MLIAPKENDVLRGKVTGAIYQVVGITRSHNMVLRVLVAGRSRSLRNRKIGSIFSTNYRHMAADVIGRNYKAKK